MEAELARAAELLQNCRALVILAGAGMGVDSGLPDFRGNTGFWQAYPPFAKLGLSFVQLANPDWFERDPALAWGFYGHRLELYRRTRPHRGFEMLRGWRESHFVFTSNVDGHFEQAGFDPARILECHGSLSHLQCTGPCCPDIWSAAETSIQIDESEMRAQEPLPKCPQCGSLARPNVLMFGDGGWLPQRAEAQEQRFFTWIKKLGGLRDVVAVEIGAGTAVPSVRQQSENLARHGAKLIRINPREPEVPPGHIGIALPAVQTLEIILKRNAI